MKKLIQLSGLVFGLIFLASCSSKTEGGSIIPKDALMVTVIDAKSILQKANLKEGEDAKWKETLKNELIQKDIPEKIAEEIIKDPQSSGIDLSEHMFAFMVQMQYSQGTGFSCNLKSASDFEEIVTAAGKEIKKGDGYQFFLDGDYNICGWDDDKVLFYADYSDDPINNFKNIFNQKKESVFDNKSFKDFYSDVEDIGVWFNSSNLSDIDIPRQLSYLQSLSGFQSAFYITGENGKMEITSKYYENPDAEIKVPKNLMDDLDAEWLKYFSKNTKGMLAFKINPKVTIDYFEQIFEKSEGQSGVNDLWRFMEEEIGLSKKDLQDGFDGNVLLVLEDLAIKNKTRRSFFDDTEETYETMATDFSILMDFKDAKMKQKIASIMEKSGLSNEGGLYKMGDDFTFLIKDDFILFTSERNKANQILANKLPPDDLSDNDLISRYSSRSMYGFMDFNRSSYSTKTLEYLDEDMGEDNRKIMAILKEVVLQSENGREMNMEVRFKDAKKNAWEQIFKVVGELN